MLHFLIITQSHMTYCQRYFHLNFFRMELLKIVFYKFYKFCRILILVTLKMKITKNSPPQIL